MTVLNESPEACSEEPPHSWEIHVKHQLFILRAQLHHIPETFIDLDVSREKGINLSTKRFTKKFALSLAFPKTVSIGDTGKTEANLDRRGILTVRVPLKRISAKVVAEFESRKKDGQLKDKKNCRSREDLQVQSKDLVFLKHEHSQIHSIDEVPQSKKAKLIDSNSALPKKQKATLISDGQVADISKKIAEKADAKLKEQKKKMQLLDEGRLAAIEARKARQSKKDEVIFTNFNKVLEEKKKAYSQMLNVQKNNQVAPSQTQRRSSRKSVTFAN